jgi:hypothetical protein
LESSRKTVAEAGANGKTKTRPELRVSQRLLLFGDDFALRRHLRIQFNEAFPLSRNIVLMENGLDRALGDASLAIDALIGMDVEHLFPFVEALYGANNNAIGIAAAYARLGNNVSHDENLSNELPNRSELPNQFGKPTNSLWISYAVYLYLCISTCVSLHACLLGWTGSRAYRVAGIPVTGIPVAGIPVAVVT